MDIRNFSELYLAELQELVSVEDQLAELLLRMAEMTSHPTLRNALLRHRQETEIQKERLESMLLRHGADPKQHIDQAMQALVKEAEKMLGMVKGNDLRDAALIGSAQRLKHYEIAAYGIAAAFAGQLGLRDDQDMLHETLEEEKRADIMLSQFAKREVNPDALAA
jgi:ferritin-like metal-binding protein YciE